MPGRRTPRRRSAPRSPIRRALAARHWPPVGPWAPAAVLLATLAAAVATPSHAAGLTQWTTNGVAVCTAAGNQQNPQLAPDGAGGAIITWQDRRGSTVDDIYALRLRADGTPAPGWPANGLAVCIAPFNQSVPQIAPDGAGGAIVTWQDGRASGINDIYAQHVLAGGTVDPAWPANGLALCTASGSQGIPQIVPDGAGGAIVAWQDPRNGNSDIYAQRVLAGGSVDPAWPADGAAVCTAIRTQASPRMVTDGAGGAIVTWQDARNGSPLQEIYDIYAQRMRVTGTADPAWPLNGVPLCLAYSNQLGPQIATDGAGGAIVTWYDRRSGQPIDPIFQDIFAQRVSGAGVPQWTPDGVAVCTAVSTQMGPVIAPDGAGGAIIAWQDFRSDVSYDVYAQHVRADSTIAPGWPVNGVALSSASSSQETPQIVSDGAGGAIVTWFNVISPPSFGPIYRDVYAQRVLANGTIAPGWLGDGIAVCAADSTQQNPQIVTDGAGGAIITWQDSRAGGTNPLDVYAQRVNDHPCAASSAAGQLLSCGVVDWTNPAGGAFDDIANWNGGAGPVPSGICPASCAPYDARFGIGASVYGVSFSSGATSATVTVAAGDHPTLHLAGNTYQVGDLHLEGAGSGLTVEGGTVAVDGAIQIGQAAALQPLSAGSGRTPAGAPPGPSSFRVAASGSAALTGNGVPESIVFEPGGVLISAAAIPYDLENSGTLSPGAETDGVGRVESNASYTQSAGGTLIVDLGGSTPGTGYDAMRFAGPATLGGTLAWKLVAGYLPAIGQEFEVLVAHPRTGVFDSVAVDIGVSYTDTSVVLTAIPTTPALASLVSAEAEPGRVSVRWFVSGAGAAVSLYRARGLGGWALVGSAFPDGTGMVRYVDTDVTPGRYGYRLGLPSDTGEIAAGEVWVDVPATSAFGLRGVSPNPAHGPLAVSFSLGAAEPAALELYDPSGRRLQSRTIDSPRPGNRVLTLGTGRELASGVYLLRLTQGARHATCRVAVVR
jgi:hypothetical protein